MFKLGVHDTQLQEVSPMTGRTNWLGRPESVTDVQNRVDESYRAKLQQEVESHIDRYRHLAANNPDANTKTKLEYFAADNYQSQVEEEQVLRQVIKLARVGTMRIKDREAQLELVKGLSKVTFPPPSRQLIIDWTNAANRLRLWNTRLCVDDRYYELVHQRVSRVDYGVEVHS